MYILAFAKSILLLGGQAFLVQYPSEAETNLVNHSIPGKPGIINDDVNLATAKLGRSLHQRLDVTRVCDISDDGQRTPGLGGVDSVSDGTCLLCG